MSSPSTTVSAQDSAVTPTQVCTPGGIQSSNSIDEFTEPSTIESKSVGGEKNGETFSGREVSLEEAIRLTGYGKFHIIILFVVGCVYMSGIMQIAVSGFLLPSASCELDMDDNDKGLLGASIYIGIVASSHTWGLIADTKGRRKALLWASFLQGVASLATSLAPDYQSLLLLRFLCGVFTSAPAALCFAYLGEFHTPATRSRSLIWTGAFGPMALIILPGLAWAVLPKSWGLDLGFVTFTPWRLLLVLCAFISLVAATMLYVLLPESPKFLSTRNPQKALAVLRTMYAKNTGNAPEKYPVDQLIESPGAKPTMGTIELQVETTESEKEPSSLAEGSALKMLCRQTAPLFRPPYLWHTFLVCVLQFGNLASANGLRIFLPEIFNRLVKYELAHEGEPAKVCEAYNFVHQPRILQSRPMDLAAMDASRCDPVIKDAVFINNLILGGCSLVVPLLCGTIVNFVGKRNLLVVCLLLTGVCFICITVSSSSSQLLGLCCVIFPINVMGIAHISSIVVELFPTNVRAMAVSLHLMSGRLGSVTGSLIFGALLAQHCTLPFYAIGGALLTCSVLSCFLPARGKFAA